MAVFYQHIKGITSSGDSWKIDVDAINTAPVGYGSMNTPTFRWVTNSTTTNEGFLITSNADYGRINKAFYFLNTVYFHTLDSTDNSIGSYKGEIGYDNNSGIFIRGGAASNNSATMSISATQMKFQGVGNAQDGTRVLFLTKSRLYNSANFYDQPVAFCVEDGYNYRGFSIACFTESQNGYVSSSDVGDAKFLTNVPIYAMEHIKTNSYIHADSYIEGTYFNATSDARAKKNITLSAFNALDIVKNLPIYNFKYKEDDSDAIGIIAQEALKFNAGNFSLVRNPEASGENGDYMSVRESKLVYIAWKAIQEQQQIIDKQQQQIKELTNLVNELIKK